MNSDYRYEIVIYWSEPDRAFVAEVPELPGCSADGLTYASALKSAETTIQEWVDTARSLGREIPVPRGMAAVNQVPTLERPLIRR